MGILIVGSTFDDISYIVTKMDIEKSDVIAKDVDVYIGKYAEKDVVVLATGQGELLSSLVTAIALEKYDPYMAIQVGTVHSFYEYLKQTHIFLANRIYLANIDQMALGRLSYGQIPDMKPFFTPDAQLVEDVKNINANLSNMPLKRGIVISDDIFRTSREKMFDVVKKHYAKMENVMATDSSSGGFAVSCSKFNVPFVCIKVCSYELGNKEQLITSTRMGLSVQPYVGKLIYALLEV